MRKPIKVAVGLCAAAGIASAASAGSATANLDISASVVAACTIDTTPVVFGTYSGAQVDATGTVTANCVLGTAWTIGLGAGSGTGATTSTRKMTSGANTLAYSLYTDATHSTNWGNSGPSDMVAGTGTGSSQAQTVYGRIAQGTIAPPGNYADTVVATINF
ncbi:MAG: spore coat U domain-containing protein [Sphingomonas sp.]|nr:spore coat U domain-containing protein [Sphingomonas sp.]